MDTGLPDLSLPPPPPPLPHSTSLLSPGSESVKSEAEKFLLDLNTRTESSYAKALQQLSYESRKRKRNFVNEPEYVIESRENAYMLFFDTFIKNPSHDKIEKRAEEGYTTAVIFEYTQKDYFYVDYTGKVCLTDRFDSAKKVHYYKIYNVMRSQEFIKIMNNYFVNKLGIFHDYYNLNTNGVIYIEVCWADPKKEIDMSNRWKKFF